MFKLLTSLVLIMAGTAVLAAPIRYDCKLQSHSNKGWGVKDAIYWFNPADQSIMAIDAQIHHATKEPIRVNVETFGPPIYKFSYKLKLPTLRNDVIWVSYGVRFDAEKNRLSFEAFPGNSSRERSTGSCTRRN